MSGSFTRKRPAGADRFSFSRRLSGHALMLGRYRLVATATATATAAGGRPGPPSRAAFRIVR